MSLQAALPRQAAADHRPSLIEEILLEWVLAGERLPRTPRRRPSRPLLERSRPAQVDDELELAMPLRWAA
jgi:hypothetical protein